MFRETNDIFRQMDDLRREFERVTRPGLAPWSAEGAFGGSDWRFPFTRFSFLPGLSGRSYPLVNVVDDGEAYVVEALAPGLDPKQVDVSITGNEVRIAGVKKAHGDALDERAWHRRERSGGNFVRTVRLPGEVDREAIAADYRDGLLTVRLPKSDAQKLRKIDVNVG